MPDRDPALVPGPTAQQWDGRSRIALACGILAVPVALIGIALGATPSPTYAAAFGVLFVAGFAAWIVLGQRSLAVLQVEKRAGYSTLVDAAGYELRNPVTGALERAADVPPIDAGRVRRSFLLDNFRLRKDTWAGQHEGQADPRQTDPGQRGPTGEG